jgi:hypothetical protein
MTRSSGDQSKTKGNISEPERFACRIALEIRTDSESMITAQRCQNCKLDEEQQICQVGPYGDEMLVGHEPRCEELCDGGGLQIMFSEQCIPFSVKGEHGLPSRKSEERTQGKHVSVNIMFFIGHW